jgi:hypothetical protein
MWLSEKREKSACLYLCSKPVYLGVQQKRMEVDFVNLNT